MRILGNMFDIRLINIDIEKWMDDVHLNLIRMEVMLSQPKPDMVSLARS